MALQIHCSTDSKKSHETHALSVLSVQALDCPELATLTLAPATDSMGVIFTSQNAVLTTLLPASRLLTFLEKRPTPPVLAAVGLDTANEVSRCLVNSKLCALPVLTPTMENGLFPLLHDLKSLSSLERASQIVIVTARGGRTVQTLSRYNNNPYFLNFVTLETYELLPSLEKTSRQLLALLSKRKQDEPVNFHCRSGLVVKALLETLLQMFSAPDAQALPPYFHFFLSGESSLEAAEKLGIPTNRLHKNP